MRSSRWLRSTPWATVLQKWQALSRAPPTKRQDEAIALLGETVSSIGTHVEEIQSRGVEGQNGGTSVAFDTSGSALLGNPTNSILIWQTLRRQRVPWKDSLALLSQQYSFLSSDQASAVRQFCKRDPSQHALAVLRAWERVDDPSLVECYHALKRTASVVAYAKIVSAALRSRPDLKGVLPVTRAALQHLYTLACEPMNDSAGVTPPGTKPSTDAATIALTLCRHLALLQSASLSRRAREALDLGYACVQARSGNWSAALATVARSASTRQSSKVAWHTFVQQKQLWSDALRAFSDRRGGGGEAPARAAWTGQELQAAMLAAPHWAEALALLRTIEGQLDAQDVASPQWPLRDSVVTSFLSREDVTGSSSTFCHTDLSSLFLSISPQQQTFAVARRVVGKLPQSDASYVCTAVAVLRASATRMFSGTLARRYLGALRLGDWASALVLSLASGAFDLTADVMAVPQAACQWGEGSGARQPADWARFDHVRRTLLQKAPECLTEVYVRAAMTRECSRCATDDERTAVLLALALYGGDKACQVVRENPLAHQNDRLRAYVLANQLQQMTQGLAVTETQPEKTPEALRREVGCFLFARPSDTALVASWASDKARSYFLKVLPPSLRHSLKRALTMHTDRARSDTLAPLDGNARASSSESVVPRAVSPLTVAEGVSAALQLLGVDQRAAAVPVSFSLARCASSGVFAEWPEAPRLGVAIAALSVRSGRQSEWGLDASAAAAAASPLPLNLQFPHAAAVQRTIEARLLLGQWRHAVDHLAQWRAWLTSTGSLAHEGPRVLSLTRLCACHAPVHVATSLVKAELEESVLWRAHGSDALVAFELRLLAAALDLLTANDTRQLESVLADCTQSTRASHTLMKKSALSCAFCLLSDETHLSRALRAAGQERVSALHLDDHAAQRLILALPMDAALSALTSFSLHQRTIHEHWVTSLLARCPASQLSQAGTEEPIAVLRRFQPRSLSVSAVCTAKACAATGDLLGFLVALNRFVALTWWPYGRHSSSTTRTRKALPRLTIRSLVYLLNDILAMKEQKLASQTDAVQIGSEALALYHTLCRDTSLSRPLLDRGGGRVTILTVHAGSQEDSTSFAPRAWLLLAYIHRILARHQRVPIAAATTSHELFVCCHLCPDAWPVALFLFQQLRQPRLEECEACFAALSRSPNDVVPDSLLPLIQSYPEQALVWLSDASLPSRWQQALQLLHLRRSLVNASSEDIPLFEADLRHDIETRVDALSESDREQVLECVERTAARQCHPQRGGGASPNATDWLRDCVLAALRSRRDYHHTLN